MELSTMEIHTLLKLQLKRIEPDADRIIELANELKAARQRDRAADKRRAA
ncbi:hypothetical protein IVA95_16220 [Bradyrhizobium sp. 157]|nr:hypothetical protein [Bradyrhizobium sp. 157]MCK1639107.1 hypothetical protein [Bradyrhizobium sp. 157]